MVIPAGSNTYVQVKEDTAVDGLVLAGNTAQGQQLDSSKNGDEAAVAQPAPRVSSSNTKETPAEDAAKETPAAQDNSGVSLDEHETDATGNEKNQADAETEAAVKADQKKDTSSEMMAAPTTVPTPMYNR